MISCFRGLQPVGPVKDGTLDTWLVHRSACSYLCNLQQQSPLFSNCYTSNHERMIACVKLESATGSWTRTNVLPHSHLLSCLQSVYIVNEIHQYFYAWIHWLHWLLLIQRLSCKLHTVCTFLSLPAFSHLDYSRVLSHPWLFRFWIFSAAPCTVSAIETRPYISVRQLLG